MADQDKILQFLQLSGPTLPGRVAKNIGSNILLASALLSDMVSQGKVKISYLKIGGSPLYYLPSQKEKLYQFAPGNLNPKDLQSLQTLKEKKVLRESEMELLMKVSLRSLKDFAVPLQVTANGAKELFWKWHLLSEEETNNILRQLISPVISPAGEPVKAVFPSSAPARAVSLPSAAPAMAEEPAVKTEMKKEEIIKGKLMEEELIKEKPAEEELVKEGLIKEGKWVKRERGGEKQEEEEPIGEELIKKELSKEEKRPFLQKFREKITRKKKADEFFPQLEVFFSKLKVGVEQKETIRKNAEMNFLLKVPTAVGKMTYFCKAKQKRRCDEKDMSSAYMEAQMKKLPLLFLYTGELNKKAEEMLESGAFENVIVKKVE